MGTGDVNYDTMGNITYYKLGSQTINYQYNSNKQLMSTSGSKNYSFIYDDKGNVTDNGTRGFTYNTANQMVNSDGYLYTYDGNNKRVKEQGSNSTPSYSFYGSNGKLMYRNVNGQDHDYYYLGGKLVANKKGNTVTYLHSDYLGSPAAESNASGTITSRMYYQPFGEKIGTPKDDVGYTGHKFDTDLGLSYMQARYYDPVIGRFYSNDPIGYRDTHSFNRYAYANNNPYKYTDPTGMTVAKIDEPLPGMPPPDRFAFSNNSQSSPDVSAEIDVVNGTASLIGASLSAAQISTQNSTTTVGITSKNNFVSYSKGWHGNQFVTTYSLSAIGKIAGGSAIGFAALSNAPTLFDSNSSTFSRFEAGFLLGGATWGFFNPYVAGALGAYEFTKFYVPAVLFHGANAQGRAITNANRVPLYKNFR